MPVLSWRGDQHVLEHGHLGKELDELERPRDTPLVHDVGAPAGDVLAAEEHLAAGGRQHAGDAVEQRGLARAVGADDAEQLPGSTLRLTPLSAERRKKCLVRSRISRSASGRVPEAHEPLRHEQHHEDHGERVDDQIEAFRAPKDLAAASVTTTRADEGPLEAPEPAEHDHHQELDRAIERVGAGVDVAEERREAAPRPSRRRRRRWRRPSACSSAG